MSAQDLFELLRTRPFMPFRIDATDGRTYDVRHPDQWSYGRESSCRSLPMAPFPKARNIWPWPTSLALAHIVRAEELPTEAAPAGR